MDYFSRGFKSVLGNQGESDGPSGAETVEKLVDRVSSATLLEDRRDAVRAIKSLSKKFRLEVGTSAMSVLLNVLQKDRTDPEICGLALEALFTIMSTDDTNGEMQNQNNDLAVQFTEIFLKDSENVSSLLALLEEYDFRVRWPTVRLLITLLSNRAIQIQQYILVSPLGVSRLMDLLSDSREVIRNDGLLLLIHLTKGNAAIQKIVAFENAFDRLLEVITEEGHSNGGIITEDCLMLMANLFNSSNINFFREGSYIQRLVPFFDFSDIAGDSKSWNEQKVKNVLMMLKLVRALVSPGNPPQSTQSSQKIIHNCNLLKIFCNILMEVGIPAEVLTETVNTVAEIIRGNQTNQAFFSVVDAPYTPPKPAIVVLLMSMISDKQPFPLRCAVLYCFQCYLYKNPTGQSRVISTLLPSAAEANNVTAGQLLCGGLFSSDCFSNWCAATALSHALLGNKEQKEQLLRVQLATGVDSQPVSLLQQCWNILSNGGSNPQTRAAILSLLCNWSTNCPLAVSHLLNNGAVIPFLFACVEQPCDSNEAIIQGLSAILIGVCLVYNDNKNEKFTAESIKSLISTRLDPEHFLTKINDVSKTEAFTTAAKHTQIQETLAEKVLFDHEFTRQFKKVEVSITRSLMDEDETDNPEKVKQANDAVVKSYKELIREQDEELTRLKAHCKELEASNEESHRQLEKQAIYLVQMRNQVTIMKGHNPEQPCENHVNGDQDLLSQQIKNKNEQIESLQRELDSQQSAKNSDEKDSKDLDERLSKLRNEYNEMKMKLEKTQSSLSITQASLEAITTSKQNDSKTIEKLEKDVESLREELSVKQATPSNDSQVVEELREQLASKTSEYVQQRQDYEDLLVLLEDQDVKIKKYKLRLRELGDIVANDSTDDDDDDDVDLADITKTPESVEIA